MTDLKTPMWFLISLVVTISGGCLFIAWGFWQLVYYLGWLGGTAAFVVLVVLAGVMAEGDDLA